MIRVKFFIPKQTRKLAIININGEHNIPSGGKKCPINPLINTMNVENIRDTLLFITVDK